MEQNTQYQAPIVKKTNEWSIASLIGGIGGLTILPFLGSLVGVICGSIAKKQIDESGGTQEGEELAKWGMILGWIGLGLTLIVACIILALLILVGTALWNWIVV